MRRPGLLTARRSSGAATFDPSTLSLTGWWRADGSTGYANSTGTFDGVASAGSSGSRDLTQGTAANRPADGTALNGHTPPDFDGTDDAVASASAISTFVSASAWFFWALVNIDAIANNNASAFSNDLVFGDSSQFFGIHLKANGGSPLVQAYQWDGAEKKAEASISTSTWTAILARYDGTNIRLKVNNGAVQTAAAGNITTLTGTTRCSHTTTYPFNGRIADMGVMSAAESDARWDDIRTYLNARYGVSV